MINMSFQKDVVVEMEVVEVKRTMVLGLESECLWKRKSEAAKK